MLFTFSSASDLTINISTSIPFIIKLKDWPVEKVEKSPKIINGKKITRHKS